jgi:ketosteroid isomerase-like protein
MTEEQEVVAATLRFYEALEALLEGKGPSRMMEAWHHTPNVTSAHPFGEWSYGWDQILTTWQELAAVGKPGLGGSSVRDVRAFVYGDVAYTTGVFIAAPSFGGGKMNVTNVLHRVGGVWKIVHHHADKAPPIEARYEKLALDG